MIANKIREKEEVIQREIQAEKDKKEELIRAKQAKKEVERLNQQIENTPFTFDFYGNILL